MTDLTLGFFLFQILLVCLKLKCGFQTALFTVLLTLIMEVEIMAIGDVKKRVLVTGGCGFIGSRLVYALLQKGCRVRVLDVRLGRLEGETNKNLEFMGIGSNELRGGMADKAFVEQAVKDIDVIYHLAFNWDALTWTHVLPLADLFDVNIRGTLNLLEAAKIHGVRHFLFSSSCAVYGKADSLIMDEEAVCKPELWRGDPGPAYGILKLTIEKLCLMYYHRYGLPSTTFRIEVVFDDDEAWLLRRETVKKMLKGEPIEVVESDGVASIHVDEVVRAFLLATLNEKAYGQVFNLLNPATYISYRELYQFIIRLIGSKSEVKLVTGPTRISYTLESIEKIRRMLGWKPQKNKEDLKWAIAQSARSSFDHLLAHSNDL